MTLADLLSSSSSSVTSPSRETRAALDPGVIALSDAFVPAACDVRDFVILRIPLAVGVDFEVRDWILLVCEDSERPEIFPLRGGVRSTLISLL